MSLRLTWRRYRLPFRHPVRTAHGPWGEREGILLQLEDASGAKGWGEVAPIPHFGGGDVDEAARELAVLASELASASWRERAKLSGAVRFALASAERNLRPNAPGQEPAREYWPVAALLPAGRTALGVVGPLAEAGFRTFKWKVGVGDLADELVLLDDVLAQLPDGSKLRLDANGAWTRRQAERWLERCAERPIEFVEQPIAREARAAEDVLRGLAGDFSTPIALDESLVGPDDLARWLEMGWPGVWVVKLSLAGEPSDVLARLAAAQADVVFSSALETAVGADAALRAAFTWAGSVRALGFGVWPLFADARFDGPARAPFIRATDLRHRDEALWTALS